MTLLLINLAQVLFLSLAFALASRARWLDPIFTAMFDHRTQTAVWRPLPKPMSSP